MLSYSESQPAGPIEKKFKKELNSDQNCSVQVNLFMGVFSDALHSENFVKTLDVFILKLHFENGSQDFSGTTWPVLLKFTGLI